MEFFTTFYGHLIVSTLAAIAVAATTLVIVKKLEMITREHFKATFGINPGTGRVSNTEMEVISGRVAQVLRELSAYIIPIQAEIYNLGIDVQKASAKGMSAEEALKFQTKALELESALSRAKRKLDYALELAKTFKVVDKKSTPRNFSPGQEAKA